MFFMELYVILEHYLKKPELDRAFSVLLDPQLLIRREKIRNEYVENFGPVNVIYLLEPGNPIAFYQKNKEYEELIAIDIRYTRELKKFLNLENEPTVIIRKIRDKEQELTHTRSNGTRR